ncbi:MAG: hypothetical protein OXN89_21290 [Bryobacterales bacterium]|nr:hypothetical protein [Bryobacterales bacterium]
MRAPSSHGRPSAKRIVAGIPDLFFASKVSGAAKRLGIAVQLATSRSALLEGARSGPDLIVTDLDAPTMDAVGVARELQAEADQGRPRMIAFGSHVHGERLAAAKLAGYDDVLTKGQMAARISGILASL